MQTCLRCNFNFLAGLCSCGYWFEIHIVGNPEDRFSRDKAHMTDTLLKVTLNPNTTINRGSYMSAHVLLNLLNELGKRDKMRGLPSILSLFRNEINKFNNTRARIMLDSIYHMALRSL